MRSEKSPALLLAAALLVVTVSPLAVPARADDPGNEVVRYLKSTLFCGPDTQGEGEVPGAGGPEDEGGNCDDSQDSGDGGDGEDGEDGWMGASHGECAMEDTVCAASAALAFNDCQEVSISGDIQMNGLADLVWDGGSANLKAKACASFGIGAGWGGSTQWPTDIRIYAKGSTFSKTDQEDVDHCEGKATKTVSCGPIHASRKNDVRECAWGVGKGRSVLEVTGHFGPSPTKAKSKSWALSPACVNSGAGTKGSEGILSLSQSGEDDERIKVKANQTYSVSVTRLPDALQDSVRQGMIDTFRAKWSAMDHAWADANPHLEDGREALEMGFADALRNFDGNVTLTLDRR